MNVISTFGGCWEDIPGESWLGDILHEKIRGLSFGQESLIKIGSMISDLLLLLLIQKPSLKTVFKSGY